MARNNGSLVKWIAYTLAFLLTFFFESCLFNRFPLLGAVPRLSLLAVCVVATFEGSRRGSAWGLAIGLFCSAAYFRPGTMVIFCYALAGMIAGLLIKRQIGRSLLGFFVSSVCGLALLEGMQISYRVLFTDTTLRTLLRIALPECAYTLLLLIPVYFLFRAVYRKFRTDSEL